MMTRRGFLAGLLAAPLALAKWELPAAPVQFTIDHAASANRYLTMAGSQGGNPMVGICTGEIGRWENVRFIVSDKVK